MIDIQGFRGSPRAPCTTAFSGVRDRFKVIQFTVEPVTRPSSYVQYCKQILWQIYRQERSFELEAHSHVIISYLVLASIINKDCLGRYLR